MEVEFAWRGVRDGLASRQLFSLHIGRGVLLEVLQDEALWAPGSQPLLLLHVHLLSRHACKVVRLWMGLHFLFIHLKRCSCRPLLLLALPRPVSMRHVAPSLRARMLKDELPLFFAELITNA